MPYESHQNESKMKIKEVKVAELQRHPLHEELNRERSIEELHAHAESIAKHGRQKPLLVKTEDVDGQQVTLVVDGWSSVLIARDRGIETLPAIELVACADDELCDLVVDVQTNHHGDIREDYKRFSFYRKLLSKGQGFRADLYEQELNTWEDEEEE